jgi:hypothetical protein
MCGGRDPPPASGRGAPAGLDGGIAVAQHHRRALAAPAMGKGEGKRGRGSAAARPQLQGPPPPQRWPSIPTSTNHPPRPSTHRASRRSTISWKLAGTSTMTHCSLCGSRDGQGQVRQASSRRHAIRRRARGWPRCPEAVPAVLVPAAPPPPHPSRPTSSRCCSCIVQRLCWESRKALHCACSDERNDPSVRAPQASQYTASYGWVGGGGG